MSESYLGQIILFGWRFSSKNFAACNGQILNIASYETLYSVLGDAYGGDGRTRFALPDLRGRVAIHFGDSPHGHFSLGQSGGALQQKLTISTMPSHAHTYQIPASTLPADQDSPQNTVPAVTPGLTYHSKSDATLLEGKTGLVGEGNPFSIENANLTVSYQICINGILGGRN